MCLDLGACAQCKVKETRCFGGLIWACEITDGGPKDSPSSDWISSHTWWLTKNTEQIAPCMYPDHSTMNLFAPIAPSSLMLSAEINHSICLVLVVPHKILLVWSSIAIQLGMSVKGAAWNCLLTSYLELGQCTVLPCWTVCSMDSSGNLWILKGIAHSFGAKMQQPGWSLSATLGLTHHWHGCIG